MSLPIIQANRQANSENGLYLKQLAKATEQEKLQMVRMDKFDKCVILRKNTATEITNK